MAWPLGGCCSSVCVDRRSKTYDKILDTDADEYGYPKMDLCYDVRMWFKDTTFDPEWWVDDMGNLWFEFETRGEAMMFTLACL